MLNECGVPSEHGRAWTYQTVGALRLRLAVLAALPLLFGAATEQCDIREG